MKTIIVMDDTETASGGVPNSCLPLLKKNGFQCVVDHGRDNGEPLVNRVEVIGKRLYNLVKRTSADGIVMDVFWGESVKFNGFEIWDDASARLKLPNPCEMVVFVTAHTRESDVKTVAKSRGFDERQAWFKHAQGNEQVVRWFCKMFGIEFTK